MDSTTKLEKIKQVLGITKKEKELFEVSKLQDGTLIGSTTDSPFAKGDQLQVMAEDGTVSCPADGEYTLEDNRVLVIADCTLSEIKDATTPAPTEEKATQTETPTTVQQSAVCDGTTCTCKDKFSALEEKIKVLEESLTKFSALEKSITDLSKVQEKFSAVVDILKTEPATEPIKRTGESTIDTNANKSKLFPEKSKMIDSLKGFRNNK